MANPKNIGTVPAEISDCTLGDAVYKNLVENASDGIAVIQDTLIKYTNPTLITILGYTRDEVVGTSYTKYLTPDALEQVTSHYQGLARQSVPDIYMATVRHKNGQAIPMEINTSVISLNGRIADFVIFRSLKERRYRHQIAERMQQARKLESLGVLAGGISHDFNNLFQGILGNADLAMMYQGDPDLVRVCLNDIKQAAHRASELALKMLAYSGKGYFDIRATDVNQIVMDTSDIIDLAVPRKCDIVYSLAASLPKIKADQSQLSQAVLNLLNNAVEAIGDTVGSIHVATELCHCDRHLLSETYLDEGLPEGAYVCLKISDTGTGIKEEALDKIFDPFFSTKFTGRGLGLAAVLGIVRAHNGAIAVDSTFDRGTTFRIYLPISDTTPAVTATKRATTRPAPGRSTILLVDDDPTVRSTATRILERFGYTVISAPDGTSALNLYTELSPLIDLVLLDMMMPKLGGRETFVKLYDINNDIKVVLMSGYQEDDVRACFTERIPTAFLQKPFTARKLVSNIRRILA